MAGKKYVVAYDKSAEQTVRGLRTYDKRQVLDAIDEHLEATPTQTSKSTIKKMAQPFWCQYRLRVGDYRVYYDVDEEQGAVLIREVTKKGRQETAKERDDDPSGSE